MANYPQELAQDEVCQSHTGHMTGLWFLPARPLRLNTNEWMANLITPRYLLELLNVNADRDRCKRTMDDKQNDVPSNVFIKTEHDLQQRQ